MDKQTLIAWLQNGERLTTLAVEISLKAVVSIAIFYFGKWAVEALVKLIRYAMKRGGVDETLRDFLANVLYGVLLALVVVTALTQLGVETTAAAAVLGGAALAIGLSLQSQLSSLAAGVILIIFRPFKKGDLVDIGGTLGVVEEIKIVHTRLRSPDNRELTVPNSAITTQTIINLTTRPLRRVDVVISVAYEADLPKARTLLQEIARCQELALKQPEPQVEIASLAASSVDFNVWVWTKTENFLALKTALLQAIKLRFDAEGIVIPFQQVDVRIREQNLAGKP